MVWIYKVIGQCQVDGNITEGTASCEINDSFHDYIHDLDIPKILDSNAWFQYKNGKLFVCVEYVSTNKFSEEQKNELISYTQGQWSDGIGEGYEQHPQYVDGEEIYISMWYLGQKAQLEETFIAVGN